MISFTSVFFRFMEKSIKDSLLLDNYEQLLTEKQREIMRLYVDYDVSLSEIADQLDSTRQAVYDTVKSSLAQLETYENKLGLVEKSLILRESIQKLENILKEDKENKELALIKENLEKILKN